MSDALVGGFPMCVPYRTHLNIREHLLRRIAQP